MRPTPTRSVSEALRSQNQVAPNKGDLPPRRGASGYDFDASSDQRSFMVARVSLVVFLIACMLIGGCTSLSEYLQNGLKVGPNYGRPPAPVAQDWIDAADKRVRSDPHDVSAWYTVFKDPVLDSLVCSAYQQNLTLRQAGSRVLQARAQFAIASGNFFPQTQNATGDYTRNAVSTQIANHSNV